MSDETPEKAKYRIQEKGDGSFYAEKWFDNPEKKGWFKYLNLEDCTTVEEAVRRTQAYKRQTAVKTVAYLDKDAEQLLILDGWGDQVKLDQ